MIRRVLILIIIAELVAGGFLIAHRLLRATPPEADWSLLDPATAEEIRAAAATCESAADWRNLGELYMGAGFFAESEACHRIACDLDPKNALYARQWAFALERLALLDDANAQYRRAMELAADQADPCRYFIARNLLRMEKPAEARKVFEEGIRLPANHYELARLLTRAGALPEASTMHAELFTKGRNLLQVNLLGYRLAVERGDERKAFEYADRARYAPRKLLNPFDEEADRLVKVTAELGPGRHWKKGRDLIGAGRLEEARKLLEDEGRKDRSAAVLELLGEIALRQSRFDDAIALFGEFQERHGPFARITARMGDVWDAAGQPTKAREHWLKAVQLQAGVDLKATHHKLADSLTKAGDEAGAKRHRALGHYYVGRDLVHFGYAPKAIDYFAAAVKNDPSLTQAWFYLGESNRLSGQKKEAIEAYHACLERNPHHGRALASLGALEKK